MAAGRLAEPRVLAHTKRELFDDAGPGYVVADTQFARDRWLDDRAIEDDVRTALAPFNHVRVGGGYPDLVAVDTLADDLLAVDRQGDRPPLVAVEAKGYRADGAVDSERAVVQAHDRLGEANVAFAAVPAGTVTATARSLARELNVGVLAVAADGDVRVRERPRVVGNRASDAATALRFQASAQGVTDRSFGLNHPKNYLGVPLALAHDGETRPLIADRVVGAVDDAVRGAAFLDLVDERPDGLRLTELGREVVRFALAEHGDLDTALSRFADWHGTRGRFVDVAPRWGQLARRVVYAYPATELLVSELRTLAADGHPEPTLVELVRYLHEVHPTFTVELFLRGTESVRRRALTADGELRAEALTDGSVYHAPTVFQLKAMYYHAGVLTGRGAEPSTLDPATDVWALRHPVDAA
ncbi:hypothetical protein [Haloarcula litorea]|uniref:hypothetical protein n=1 Tax=Haloarcula litorea TaxID=3032579 RepID=UPI0023E8EC9A|nr:hypothetical protein [Halomicroarcula sp. GDY20]